MGWGMKGIKERGGLIQEISVLSVLTARGQRVPTRIEGLEIWYVICDHTKRGRGYPENKEHDHCQNAHGVLPRSSPDATTTPPAPQRSHSLVFLATLSTFIFIIGTQVYRGCLRRVRRVLGAGATLVADGLVALGGIEEAAKLLVFLRDGGEAGSGLIEELVTLGLLEVKRWLVGDNRRRRVSTVTYQLEKRTVLGIG
jgi:hypothetical protein